MFFCETMRNISLSRAMLAMLFHHIIWEMRKSLGYYAHQLFRPYKPIQIPLQPSHQDPHCLPFCYRFLTETLNLQQ